MKLIDTPIRHCAGRLAAVASVLVLATLALMAFAIVTDAGIGPAQAGEHGKAQHVYVDKGTRSKRVKLGLNKSMTVHLPRPAREVLVGNPKKVDAVLRTARTTYLIGNEVGQTNAFFFDAAGEEILSLEIVVERDVATLRQMMRKLVTRNRVKVEAVNDNVVLTGTVANASESKRAADLAGRFIGEPEKVLNLLQIAGKEQVMLRVTIAEMQRTVLKQLGVDVQGIAKIGRTVLNLASFNPFTLFGEPLSDTAGSLSHLHGGGTSGVAATVRAMERNGLLRTLAEPTLTAISGESAKFRAGGEFPVPSSRDSEGNVIVEFKPFGVGLAFSPLVLSEGRISMKISTEVSETTTDNAFVIEGQGQDNLTIPGLRVRRAETTVELPSGGSLVMAGLIQEATKQNLNGVPGIKDVPILGALFRSRDFQNAETELVVIVTPYVVNPTTRDALRRPDHQFQQPHDMQTIFLGRLNKVYGVNGGPLPQGRYSGSYGFIVD